MMSRVLLLAVAAAAVLPAQQAEQAEVRRVYVEALSGGGGAEPLRQVIISSLNATGLFILTDDPKRADAILRGAADDSTFTNTYDSDRSGGGRVDAGLYGSGSRSARSGGGYGGSMSTDREAYHIKERKHEAYAAVRLVNRAGDTLWSTTQESQGAKFRGASTDVGAKIAHQMVIDMARIQRSGSSAANSRP
jgi:hypothetical protein